MSERAFRPNAHNPLLPTINNDNDNAAYGWLSSGISYGASQGFVEPLNATQRPGHTGADTWFQGTADAVRQYAYLLSEPKHEDAEDVLILSADQLYGMDYAALINYHRLRNADVTIATTPAGEEAATHLGVLQVDASMNVTGFAEKPGRRALSTMSIDTSSCYGEC